MYKIDNKPYITVSGYAQNEFTEKKSRFIGYINHVTTEKEAIAFINEIKSKHKDARHNVYAYSLKENNLKRFSDDGEPQGTAGKPILEVLEKEELVDTVIVVTRYFGGILLGTGGLARAYTQGAKMAIEATNLLNMTPCYKVDINLNYDLYGKVQYILPQYNVKTIDTQFTANINLTIILPTEYYDSLAKKIEELSNGTVTPNIIEKSFYDI